MSFTYNNYLKEELANTQFTLTEVNATHSFIKVQSTEILQTYKELAMILNNLETKFICFNDNRDYDNPLNSVVALLIQSFQDTLFPHPSTFENAYVAPTVNYDEKWNQE